MRLFAQWRADERAQSHRVSSDPIATMTICSAMKTLNVLVGTCALFLRSPDRLLPRRLLQYQCRRSRHPCYLRKAHPRIFTIFSGTWQRSDHSQTGVPVYWAAPGRPLVPVRITLERSFRCRSGTRRRTGKLPRQGLGLRQSGALASPRALAATAARPPLITLLGLL